MGTATLEVLGKEMIAPVSSHCSVASAGNVGFYQSRSSPEAGVGALHRPKDPNSLKKFSFSLSDILLPLSECSFCYICTFL